MRLALAAGILAQTLPAAEASVTQHDHNSLLRGPRETRRQHAMKLAASATHHALTTDLSMENRVNEEIKMESLLLTNPVGHELVECHPRQATVDEADVGILSCGMRQYCSESEASSLGGYCASISAETSDLSEYQQQQGLHRELQDITPPSVCDPDSLDFSPDCDCTNFNQVTGFGSFTCTLNDYICFGDYCGAFETVRDIAADGTDLFTYKYSLITPFDAEVSYTKEVGEPICSVKVDDTQCSSCTVDYSVPVQFGYCYIFNCTNTFAGATGRSCEGPTVFESLRAAFATSVPSASPTTAAPTAKESMAPTITESTTPTSMESMAPTVMESMAPTVMESMTPTVMESMVPTITLSMPPSVTESLAPTIMATENENMMNDTMAPTTSPSVSPAKDATDAPTKATMSRTTADPTMSPVTMMTTSAPSSDSTTRQYWVSLGAALSLAVWTGQTWML